MNLEKNRNLKFDLSDVGEMKKILKFCELYLDENFQLFTNLPKAEFCGIVDCFKHL